MHWTIKSGRSTIFYWVIVAIYLVIAIRLMFDFFSTPDASSGGGFFVIEMYAMIVPGVLILISVAAFFAAYLGPKK